MGAVTVTGISGKEGFIRIPALGALIGRTASWSVQRRGEDDGPKEGSYVLRASLSYVNRTLFTHPEYSGKREIQLRLNRSLTYQVQELPDTRVALEGNTLTMEGVDLCRL